MSAPAGEALPVRAHELLSWEVEAEAELAPELHVGEVVVAEVGEVRVLLEAPVVTVLGSHRFRRW